MMKSYFETRVGHNEHLRRLLAGSKERFYKGVTESLFQVDFNGEVSLLRDSDKMQNIVYLEKIRAEAGVFAQRYYNTFVNQANMFRLSRRDRDSWNKWADRVKQVTWASRDVTLPDESELTQRANKLRVWLNDNIVKSFEQNMALYKLMAPHNFCISPFVSSDLEKSMSDNFLGGLGEYRVISGWLKSPLLIYSSPGYRFDLGMWVNPDSRLKLKMYCKHETDGLLDVLDVEAQFRGGRFEDIVHYDIKKRNTLMKISNAHVERGEIIDEKDSIVDFEMSGNPRSGSVKTRMRTLGGQERMVLTDLDSAKRQIFVVKYWASNPVIAGGELLKRGIEIIENDGRYESLVGLAKKKVSAR